MTKINNLAQGNLGDVARQQHRDRYATPLNGSSVGSGGQRFYGTGRLTVENEGLYVVGVANISGTLAGDGTLNWSGDVNVTGPTSLDGPTDVGGALTVDGTMDIKGKSTLQNDLDVTSGGKIKVGGMTLDPTANGGSVVFSGGGGVQGQAGVTAIKGAGNAGVIMNDYVSVFAGASTLDVRSAGITATGNTTFSGYLIATGLTETTAAANMFVQANGWIYKSTSAAKFKIDPAPMDLPDSLLEVPVKSWIDLGSAEAYAALYTAPHPRTELQSQIMDGINLTRVPGIVAEEVEAAGGEAFVTYDIDGTIEGVSYDRLALARTEILARKVKRLESSMNLG